MSREVPCCGCGTALLRDPKKPATAQSLCSDCWRAMPSAEIVRRSHEHDKVGHAHDRRSPR